MLRRWQSRWVPRRWSWRRTAAVLVAAALIAVSLYARAELWSPPTDHPAPADAIIVLGGSDARLPSALRLYYEGYAKTALVSVTSTRQQCPTRPPPGLTLVCFVPHPFSTRGEARYIAAMARQRHWTRVIVVSGHTQTTRARLRIQRCWSGQLLMVPAPPPGWRDRLYQVVYELGATLKAELWQRGC